MRPALHDVRTSLAGAFRAVVDDRPWGPALLFALAAYVVTVVLNAWTSDDAYITFRVVDNVIHGHGFVWNIGERVQAFTNPLMMLAMAFLSFLTREVYFTSIVLSVAASTAAVAVLAFKVARTRVAAVLGVLLLIFSSSFVTYSTSGLENCLIFLLTALFFWKYLEAERHDGRSLTILTLLFSLSLVNRMDTGLLLLPALVLAYVANDGLRPLRLIGAAVLGMVPFVVWEAFSIVYYGFLFPNTAYAKLNTGIPEAEYLIRGVWYYVLSFLQDPLVLLAIVFGAVVVVWLGPAKSKVALVGVALYLAYILYIGGDFMRGRYFAAPMLVVLLLVVSIDEQRWRAAGRAPRWIAAAALALVVLQNAAGMIYVAMDFNQFTPYGIYNDKAIYFPTSNLMANLVNRQLLKSRLVRVGEDLRAGGRTPVVRSTLGFAGYYAGPGIHIVDPLALSDALLARLPAVYNPAWHVGHYERYVPDGYLETFKTGRNVIKDPKLATYYDKLSLVIKGGLWSRARWQAIYELNTGKLDGLIDKKHYRYEVKNAFDVNAL